jgi:hypothetical protein
MSIVRDDPTGFLFHNVKSFGLRCVVPIESKHFDRIKSSYYRKTANYSTMNMGSALDI